MVQMYHNVPLCTTPSGTRKTQYLCGFAGFFTKCTTIFVVGNKFYIFIIQYSKNMVHLVHGNFHTISAKEDQ